MAKRISRKLLVGLGSVVTFGAVGTVSGFGVKSIIDSTINHNQANQSIKSFPEADYTQMSNYNVASKDMFIDTTDLSRFHFGNVQKGQTVTPYGWIGAYSSGNTFQNIALIGWNGEVIWKYENTGPSVYDIKYDYNTDLLFVLKTTSSSGISQDIPIELDVLDAKTGRRVDQVREEEFKTIRDNAWNTLLIAWNLGDPDKIKNLMQVDLISKKGKTNEVVFNWMPDYMQLGDRSNGLLASLYNFRSTWSSLMNLIKFSKQNDQSGLWTHSIIQPDSNLLFGKFSFNTDNSWEEPAWGKKRRFLENYTLITNPFFTINNDNSYVLHLIVASNGTTIAPGDSASQEEQRNGSVIIHKAVGLTNDFQANTKINIFQQMGGVKELPKAPYYSEYNNWPYKMAVNSSSRWFKVSGIAPDAMTKANKRINRNMFDNNSIITPYRYSVSNKYPIYDVMQLNIDPATGKISFDTNSNNKKMTKRWSFGQDIVNYYDRNKSNYGSATAENQTINRIYPYPDIGGSFDVNHNYNRLISVSPFDNTFIYAAKPYLKYTQFNPDNNANNDKYAGFWIASDQIRNNKPQIRPLVIVNDQGLKGSVDPKMTSIDKIYDDGFTFDPTSFYTSSDGKKHLNLYFNQNGTEKNTAYTSSGMKSSKIGLLKDVLSVANREDNEYNGEWVWTTSIAEKYLAPYNEWTLGISTTGIARSDFSTLIHSRADLTKWYTRTWKNLNFAGNLFGANQQINDNDTSSNRAIAKTFGDKLQGNEFSSGQSVDLVSAWKDKSASGQLYATDPTNYNRLAIKRPIIKVAQTSTRTNSLPVITRYEMSAQANKIINEKPTWGLRASLQINDYNKSIMVLQKVQTINNVSTQIVSSWKEQYRMGKIQRTTDQLSNSNTAWFEVSPPAWQDKITTPNLAFGNANNNVAKNSKSPLRLMLKLVKPTGNLPDWFGNNFDDYFAKAYPIEAINNNETSFAQMVKEYANKKAKAMKLSDPKNANTAVGLGNLKIEAYLELNPGYNNSSKIYHNGNSSQRNIKKYLDDPSGVIIYQDSSDLTKHLIYDQSQILFSNFNKGAFGDTSQSPVRQSIIDAWKPNAITGNFQIKVSTEYNQLQNNLVRKSSTDTAPLFSFNYKNGTNNQIEITPNDLNWFKNSFENYNRMIGLFVDFEYQLSGQSTTTWTKLGTTWTDDSFKTNFATNKNKLLIQNAPDNIEKIRFRLKQGNQNDANLAIDMIGFDANESKYISDPVTISIKKINVNKDWIANQILSNQSFSLTSLVAQDVINFETNVLNNIANQTERNAVKLVYSFDGSAFNLDANALVQKIKDKFNNFSDSNKQGVFALWNGTNGSQLIRAKFELKDPNGNFKLVTGSNQNPGEADLSNHVKSTIKSKIDLADYINQLSSSRIVSQAGTAVGTIKPGTIQIPNKTSAGRFQNKSFDEIKTTLQTVGIKIKFQKQEQNGSWNTTWTEDLNQISTYSTKDPKFRIGFFADANYNAEILNGTTVISNGSSIELKLNLPKVITINNGPVNTFQANHGLGGNTKKLTYTQANIDKLINDIKQDGANASIPEINNAPLEVLFQLGGSGDYQTIDQLKTTLLGATSDKSSNLIKIKFRIANNNPDWILNNPNGEYTVLNANNSTVPIFIHDLGIFDAIKNRTTISGTNTNLTWSFPTSEGFTIQSDDTFSNTSSKGKGLKLEFTTNKNLDVNAASGWGSRINNVNLGVDAILIRIVAKDGSYIYQKTDEKNNAKIQINLDQIREQINVQSSWLNKSLVTNQTDLKAAITLANLDKYEKAVMAGITTLNPATKNKLVIKYHVGSNPNPIDKNALVNLVNSYTNNGTFNILQLWNGSSGIKINAVFAKADANGLYDLIYANNDPQYQQLDTTKITTTIVFDKVIQWLTNANNRIAVEKLANNKIKIKIPNIPNNIGDTIFQNKSWDGIQKLFSSQFGITIEYRSLTSANQSNQNDWSNSWENVNLYDENIGKFQIRFKFDGTKSKNIKLKLTQALTADGTNANTTDLFTGYLLVKLTVKVNPQYPTNFNSTVNRNVISGDTKRLVISQQLEEQMLNDIKNENIKINPAFKNLNLEVRYQLGEWQVGRQGETRANFQNTLLNQNDVDQSTNKISFQIAISANQTNDFAIAENNYVLHNHESPNNNTLIKYFVNKRNWEANADRVIVTGTSSNLNWNFNAFKNLPTTDVLEQNGNVYLRNEAGSAMQLQFSTKANIAYTDNVVSDDLNDLATKWVTKKPTSIAANIDNIKIRIVPMPGFIYEPAQLNNNSPDKARVHTINLTITTEIKVDKNWLANPFSEMEIKAFSSETFLNNWINGLRNQIKTLNNLQNDNLVNKITVEFTIGNDPNKYDVSKLVKEINRKLADYQSAELGIFHLWNSATQLGTKINATFKTNDPTNSIVLIENPGTTGFSNDLNTDKIYSQIDISSYVQTLETTKTAVKTKPGGQAHEIVSFTPPSGANPNGIFNNKSYDVIASRLAAEGIDFKFSKSPTGPWSNKNDINQYDPTKRKLFLAFSNRTNNNLRLVIKTGQILMPGQANAQVIGLPLAVAKQITINASDLANALTVLNFSNNTKQIQFTQNADQTIINKIKQRNKLENGNDNEYDNMPLIMKFSIGEDPEYKTLNELKAYLNSQELDYQSRAIKYQFEIPTNQAGEWIFSDDPNNPPMVSGYIANDNQSPLKIYVNDRNIFEDLGKTSLAANGTTDNFNLEWKNGIQVNQQNGSLNGSSDSKGPKGTGLKLQFTFNENLSANGSEGSDYYNSWVAKVPTSVNPGYDKLFIRIRVNDNKYFYEKIDQKITVNLNIKQIIKIDAAALNKPIVPTRIEDLNLLDKTKFDEYEKLVWKQTGLADNVKSNLKIEYTFRGQTYRDGDPTNNINALIAALKAYEVNAANEANLGILQLWNGTSGEKISTKFVLADKNSNKYELQFINNSNNNHDLDFSNLITVIDFAAVMNWLKTLELRGTEGANNSISNIQIPTVSVATKYFNNKQWVLVEKAFEQFGIKIVYSNNIPNQAEQWGPLSSVNQFDPNKGTFWMRFNFVDKTKSKNIKLKTGTEDLDGATSNNSTKVELKLKVRLSVSLDNNILAEFVRSANLTGNTKFINIDTAKIKEAEMIKKIKAANGDRYQNLDLSVQYFLGRTADVNSSWSTSLDDFKNDLESFNTDQETNKIWYRFHVTNLADFSVDESPRELSPEQPVTTNNLKIKYYINGTELEQKANQIIASGTNDQLSWNFANIFGQANVVENNQEVSIRTAAGESLKVHFTLANNADYKNPGESTNPNEIKTKWVTKKPTRLDPGTKGLKIRLVPAHINYVYGPKEDNSATAHNVSLKIQNLIIVNKDWFKLNPLVPSEVEISALTAQMISKWEEKIYEEIKRANNVDQQTAQKIKIKYLLEGDNNKYLASEFINQITVLRSQFNQSHLGIVHLWNGTKGLKLSAIFESGDQNFVLKTANNNNPTDADLKEVVNTNNVFTNVTMVKYLEFLKNNKTTVVPDANAGIGKIKSFNPPTMSGAIGSAFLAGKTYDEIANRLNQLGITIEFAKNPTGPWDQKQNIKEYDVQLNSLYLAFVNSSSNVRIQLSSTDQVGPNQNSKKTEIRLPLQVPKYIKINQQIPAWQQIKDKFNFNGNTKDIDFALDKIQEFVQAIKDDNATAGNDNSYKSAPLEIHFQVGKFAFTKIEKLKEVLKSNNNDLDSRTISFKFVITPGQENDWKLEKPNDEYTLLTENDQAQISKLKIYINDKGAYDQIKQMRLEGSNTKLVWPWPQIVKINPTTGLIEPTDPNGFGRGLKFQFSFKKDATSEGTDPETQWASAYPTSYNANNNFKNVYIRIKLVNDGLYHYDRANDMIELSLENILQQINLKPEWLDVQLRDGAVFDITNLTVSDISNYETKVKEKAQNDGLEAALSDKFEIKYSFNNSSLDENALLNKDQLFNKIKEYQANKTQSSLGILQLWNGSSGIKIIAKFVDADKSDKFIPVVAGDNQKIIRTNNVQTSIDFTKVIQWITDVNNTKIDVDPGTSSNSIKALRFPNYTNAADAIFNNVEWNKIELALSQFGINIEWRVKNKTDSGDFVPLANLSGQQYDPQIGRIQFKIRFDNNKAQNMLLKVDQNQPQPGTTTNQIYDVKLNVKLALIIDKNLVNTAFINASNVISGDTKNINIDSNLETKLIEEIKKWNTTQSGAQEFNKAPLIIEYHLGESNDSNISWKRLNQFKTDLSTQDKDQKSNKVIFRFRIDLTQQGAQDFSVDQSEIFTLHDPANKNPVDWKVKFYINSGTWETKAGAIAISGKTSNIRWNYDALATGSNLIQEQANGGNKIFVKINNQKALQVQFSTKPNISYNDQQVSDNPADLDQKWITIEPNKINPPENVKRLYIRLVAADGFVYGPAEQKQASAHKMDETQLKIEIEVDPTILSRSLTIAGTANAFVTNLKKSDLEKYVDEVVKDVLSPDLAAHVVVTFEFNGKKFPTNINNAQLDQSQIIENLYQEIQKIINSTGAPDYGILQLWNGTAGKEIKASYALKNTNGNYSLIDKNRDPNNSNDIGNPTALKTLVTGHIRTLVDLKEVVKLLETVKVDVELKNKFTRSLVEINRLNMPSIPNNGSSPFKGLDWNVFEQNLKKFGILIQARAVSDTTQNWQQIDQIKQYDPTTLKLELRFILENKGNNIVLSVLADQDVDINNNINLPTFTMTLNAPAQVVVSANLLKNFVDSNDIKGDTKNIIMDTNADSILIEAIINENIQTNEPIFSQLRNRLEVQYYLGKTASNNDSDWKNHSQFSEYLKSVKRDFDTNRIWYRLNVKVVTNDQQVFQIDKTPKQLIDEQIDDQAKVKIFVNDNGFYDNVRQLKAVGATDNFNIINLENWKKTVPLNSLEIQFSSSDLPDETNDTDWTNDVPKTLNSDKKLWLRFKSKSGYVFERAKKDDQNRYEKYSDKQPIDTTGLKVILNLEKQWLEKIEISGNTKEAQINEQLVLDEINKANILPTGKPNLITLEYHIKGTNQWFNKSDFIAKLKELKGTKDNNHFILKREELEVRYTLSEDGDYGLNIDGVNIDNTNRDQFNVQMVDDDSNRNQDFEGYINLDKLSELDVANFEIRGTTTQPRFLVKERAGLDSRFAPYASDDLFDIQFAHQQKADGKWDWQDQNTILVNGQIMNENGLIQKGINIGADRKFALRFISKNNKYKVYKTEQHENEGYVLDISKNVKIVVEIINPFTVANKTLGIWTLENNQAKYYQGEGGFRIVLADKSTLEIDKNNVESAQQFLQNSSNILENEKQALEFVYHVFGSSASTNEIDRVKKSINDYESSDWNKFPSSNKNNDQWSGNLKLKVGDYVAVAIRVKKEFSSGENAFVLRDGDHSMILPVMNDDNGKEKKPGRIKGYKVKTDEIHVDEKSILLSNMINAELPPLDGWTLLSKLNLKQDQNSNYLGVNLKLQIYTEFYEKDNSGSILISGSGAKLVKRQSNGSNIEEQGSYTDKANNPIKDKDGKEVKIYKDKLTKRLSNPTKSSTPTKEHELESLGNGVFILKPNISDEEKGRLSFFKNQDIDLQLMANIGEGTTDSPDFYLDDDTKKISIREFVDPQIKYPIENEKQITYDWNYDDFNADNIEYETPNNPNQIPEEGNAKIKTIYKLTKKQKGQQNQEITGDTSLQASQKIEEIIKNDFNGQLKFQVTRISANGIETTTDGNDIYKFNDLKNKDRIVLKIVATENDLYYAEGPRPLIINVRGLVQSAPDQNKLQFLRVKQGGHIDGQGSFKVLVSNPNDDNEDDRSILKGWKFMVRVWNSNKEIKIDWTDDQARIRGLANGDKVEWKLVSEDGNPVKEAYYNTIALEHQSNDDGSIKYNFAQIQYQNGDSTYQKVKEGIGDYPENHEYPENSGFIISGLKSAIETFKISKENFAKVIAQLQPSYVGINTQGTIHFDQKYFDQNYWVNTNGELYVKKDQVTFKDSLVNEVNEISLTEFLDHVTFYTHDPVIANYQGGFKFSGNDININNHLTNGDQMWATFDTINTGDNSGLNNNDPTTSVVTQLLDVSGLKDIIDPMSPLWYVLMALAGIATLGTAALIAFLVARHKKLKGKN